jgi:hypothetical protein
MAKRYTDTNKYKKPFIRGLQGAYKLFWDYLYHDCDHAGIWIVDFDIAQIYIGADMKINKADALKFFNQNETRIIEFDNEQKWFIKPFIDFQYGELNPANRVHNSVLSVLLSNNLIEKNKGLGSPLEGAKDKDKDKDKYKDKDKDKDILKRREKIKFSDLENTQWFESILRFLKLQINYDELMEYWKQYQEAMTADDDLNRDANDYRAHFRNWVKIQVEKKGYQNQSTFKKPNYELLKMI